MPLRLLEGPTDYPLTLDEAKEHLRVDHPDDDDYISALIASATARLDGRSGILGRAIMTQSWTLVLDRFPCEAIAIPLPPLQSVDAVRYFDTADAEQVFTYSLDANSEPALMYASTAWPTGLRTRGAVEIDFTAGYASAEDVPAPIKHSMLLQISSWYETRAQAFSGDALAQLPANLSADALISPYRVFYV